MSGFGFVLFLNNRKKNDEGSLIGAAKRIVSPAPLSRNVKFLFNSLPFSLLLCISGSAQLEKASDISRANNNVARAVLFLRTGCHRPAGCNNRLRLLW